jgi:hypothetical protein
MQQPYIRPCRQLPNACRMGAAAWTLSCALSVPWRCVGACKRYTTASCVTQTFCSCSLHWLKWLVAVSPPLVTFSMPDVVLRQLVDGTT